jgi:hypothetical protein
VCGAALTYVPTAPERVCQVCGRTAPADAECVHGHFVCDRCHRSGPVALLAGACLASREADATVLLRAVRTRSRCALHGPEHHALVPAVILTALRNAGRDVPEAWIATAIQRGQAVPGGACGFLGACGAAVGAGIAVALLAGSTPYDGAGRQLAMEVTGRVLGRIASLAAPRCCQREAWLALQETASFLEERMGIALTAGAPFPCDQSDRNRECVRDRCPLWPANVPFR